jgi:hypothetical protein
MRSRTIKTASVILLAAVDKGYLYRKRFFMQSYLNYSISVTVAVSIACDVNEQFLNSYVYSSLGKHRTSRFFKLLINKHLYLREIHPVGFNYKFLHYCPSAAVFS